jgi:hypothetical protein
MEKYRKAVKKIVNFGYMCGCFSLYVVATVIIFYSAYGVFNELQSKDFLIFRLFDEVGLIIFAIAVIDIAKYLLFEEVLKSTEDTDIHDAKRTLTKVVAIVSTALFLKGLIMTMEAAKVDMTKLVYPLLVVISPVFLLVGLGIYQFLSSKRAN